jgi:hypothetical protein
MDWINKATLFNHGEINDVKSLISLLIIDFKASGMVFADTKNIVSTYFSLVKKGRFPPIEFFLETQDLTWEIYKSAGKDNAVFQWLGGVLCLSFNYLPKIMTDGGVSYYEKALLSLCKVHKDYQTGASLCKYVLSFQDEDERSYRFFKEQLHKFESKLASKNILRRGTNE